MTTKQTKPKACPFCGGKAEYSDTDGAHYCYECGVMPGVPHDATEAESAAIWNKRAPIQLDAATRRLVRAALAWGTPGGTSRIDIGNQLWAAVLLYKKAKAGKGSGK